MFINDLVLDNGLAAVKTNASHRYICNAEPATFTQASSTFALGNKNFGAGAVYPAAIAAGSPSGRQLSAAAVTDGTVTATGTASHDAIVSQAASRLEAANALSASQAVTSGNTFTLSAQVLRLPNVGG